MRTMTGFGDALRREREARGVAIAQICAATKVSEQHVLTLEAGDLRGLPGGVFRKGIVRGYLGALGLEEAFWLEQFRVSCRERGISEAGEMDWVEFAENVKRGRGDARRGLGWKWFGVAVLVVSLWAVAWLAWYFVRHHRVGVREVAACAVRSPKSAGQPYTLLKRGVDIFPRADLTQAKS